jgi:hypothetical protein
VRGVAGMAGLFPRIFAGSPRYFCRECDQFHDSDETAEWLLIGHKSRDLTDGQFLAKRLESNPRRVYEGASVYLSDHVTEHRA